jgi:tetratricopeptide (TPR) repeat protein
MSTKLPALLVLLAGTAPVVLAQETVHLRNGNSEAGRIEAEDYDVLRFKVKKGKDEQAVTFPWAEVADVTYTGELQKAINQLNNGNRTQAIQQLTQALAGSTLRKELRPAAAFSLGIAQLREGQFPAAATTLQDLLKTAPKSRYLFPAARALADIYLATGEFDNGNAAIDAASNAAKDAGVSANHLMAFDYYRGLLNEAKKDMVKAKLSFQTASRVELPLIAELGKLGLARVADAAGQTDEARKAFTALTEQGRSNETLAGAWNGLAKLALADGVSKKKAEIVTDGLYMYLRGVVCYAPLPGDGTSEYERALAGSAEAFRQLAEFDTDDAQKKQNIGRAKQRLDLLRKEFPHSIFLPK